MLVGGAEGGVWGWGVEGQGANWTKQEGGVACANPHTPRFHTANDVTKKKQRQGPSSPLALQAHDVGHCAVIGAHKLEHHFVALDGHACDAVDLLHVGVPLDLSPSRPAPSPAPSPSAAVSPEIAVAAPALPRV